MMEWIGKNDERYPTCWKCVGCGLHLADRSWYCPFHLGFFPVLQLYPCPDLAFGMRKVQTPVSSIKRLVPFFSLSLPQNTLSFLISIVLMNTIYPETLKSSTHSEYSPLTYQALKSQQEPRKCKRRLARSKPRQHNSYKSSSSSSSTVSSSTRNTRESTVIVSPRLLPFPYHNDSLFLPTVEHRGITTRRSCSSLAHRSGVSSAFTTSLPPPPPPRRQSSAPPILSKRRKVAPSPHTPKIVEEPSPSWLRKLWKSMKRPSWQLRLSSSTKTMVSVIA